MYMLEKIHTYMLSIYLLSLFGISVNVYCNSAQYAVLYSGVCCSHVCINQMSNISNSFSKQKEKKNIYACVYYVQWKRKKRKCSLNIF